MIIKHLTYPISGNDNDLFNGDKEQEDKFKEFRYEMGDVLKDCCAVAGATKALQVPFEQIQTIISNSRALAIFGSTFIFNENYGERGAIKRKHYLTYHHVLFGSITRTSKNQICGHFSFGKIY